MKKIVLIIVLTLTGCSNQSFIPKEYYGEKTATCFYENEGDEYFPLSVQESYIYYAVDDYITETQSSIIFDFSSDKAKKYLSDNKIYSDEELFKHLWSQSYFIDVNEDMIYEIKNDKITIENIQVNERRKEGFFGNVVPKDLSLSENSKSFFYKALGCTLE